MNMNDPEDYRFPYTEPPRRRTPYWFWALICALILAYWTLDAGWLP